MRLSSCCVPNVKGVQLNTPKVKNISFQAHYDMGFDIQQVGDDIIYQRVNIHNYTALFRSVRLFKELPQYLQETYPKGAKLYEYACSCGHEAASLIMGLFDVLPQKVAKKYLPIRAFDSNPKIVRQAKGHVLPIEKEEREMFKVFENTEMTDFLSPLPRFLQRQKAYKMKRKLSDNVRFQWGDLFEDLQNGKLSKEPCVVFFRNAWQFLKPKGARTLAQSLFVNLKPGSSVIIGAKDVWESPAVRYLRQAGFKRAKPVKAPVFKDEKLGRYYDLHKSSESLSTFWFQKP